MGDEQAGRAGASLGARPREEPSCCRALVTRACGRDSSLPGRHFHFFLVTAAFLRATPLPNCSLGARRARGRRGARGEGRPRQCGRPVCWCRSQSRPSPALSSSIRGRDVAGGGGGGAAALTATGKTSTAPKRVRRLCGSPRGFSAASPVSTESPERPRRPPPATTSYLLGKSVGSRQSGYWPQPRPHLQAAS